MTGVKRGVNDPSEQGKAQAQRNIERMVAWLKAGGYEDEVPGVCDGGNYFDQSGETRITGVFYDEVREWTPEMRQRALSRLRSQMFDQRVQIFSTPPLAEGEQPWWGTPKKER